jgi:DNA-binding FadR family transcriptional regulator
MERKLHRGKTVLGEVQEFIWQLAMLSRNEIVLSLRPLRNEADRRGLLAQSSILGRPTAMALHHLANHREMVDAIGSRDPERLRRVFREEFPLQIADESRAPD